MSSVKMQPSVNTAIVLEPSMSRLTDALCIKANASAHVLVNSSDASGREVKEDVKGSNFSWFRRLKSRDDTEFSSRGAGMEAELVTSNTERGGASSERLEARSKSAETLDHISQTLGTKRHLNSHAEANSVVKHQKTMDQDKESSEAERQMSKIAQEAASKSESGRSFATSVVASPTVSGFGPWVNLRFGRRPETETTATHVAFKNGVNAATSGQGVCKEVRENSALALNASTKCSAGSTQAEASIPHTLCKPSLSPMHKLGLPPRPPGQKISGFLSPSRNAASAISSGRGAFRQVAAYENHPKEQILLRPATEVLDMQAMESEKHDEATHTRLGSSFQKVNLMEGGVVESTWHSNDSPDCRAQFLSLSSARMDNGSTSSKQGPMPGIIQRGDLGPAGSFYGTSSCGRLEDGVREPICAIEQSNTPSVDLHSKYLFSEKESSKAPLKDTSIQQAQSLEHLRSTLQPSLTVNAGSSKASLKNAHMLQVPNLEPKKSVLQRSLRGDSYHGISREDEQAAGASTSGALPWELFIEPSGTSKTAREQFVEVYNRARDELKNQRLQQNMSKASGRELDGVPKLTLGPSCTVSDVRAERQYMNHGQQFSRHMQVQGSITKIEHQALSHPWSLKDQHDAMASAESPQCKQAEGLQQLRPQAERRERLIPRSSAQELPFPRMGERSVTHEKVLSSAAKEGQTFLSSFAPIQESASNLDNHIKSIGLDEGLRTRQQQKNGQESASVLSKRPLTTLEDNAMTIVAEKGTASIAKPHNKPNLWLQRWYSTSKYNLNNSPVDEQVASVGRSDPHSHDTLRLKKFGGGDGAGAFGQASVPTDGVKNWKMSSSKILPSAAAMAIVGTAARQFCTSQPQGKRSFAFWSGFQMPTYSKDELVQEKGKEKVCS